MLLYYKFNPTKVFLIGMFLLALMFCKKCWRLYSRDEQNKRSIEGTRPISDMAC